LLATCKLFVSKRKKWIKKSKYLNFIALFPLSPTHHHYHHHHPKESLEIQPQKNEGLIPSLVATTNPSSSIAPQIYKSLFKITTTIISSLPRS
jgi:hypothetical protein